MNTSNNRAVQILIVEDNATDAYLLQKSLPKSFEWTHLETLGEACEFLQKGAVELILLDLSLPDSTGASTFETLYNQTKEIPIIVFTGLEDEELGIELVSKGAQDYLVKNWLNPQLLTRAIRYAIERHKHLKEEIRHRQRENTFFEHFTASSTSVTSQSFGFPPLRDYAPEMFSAQKYRYETLLDEAIEQQIYQVDHNTSKTLRDIAAKLCFLKAGPRDVIDIHNAALKNKITKTNPKKSKAYLEESRLIVLELMGHLASSYRTQASNGHPVKTNASP